MTATTRWSYSRSSTFIALTVLACISFVFILPDGVRKGSSSFLDKRSVSPFVRRADNASTSTSISSSSSTTALQTSSTSTTELSSVNSSTPTQTSVPPTPTSSNISHSTTTTSSSRINSTSFQALSTSASLTPRTSTMVVTSITTGSSSSSSSPTSLLDPTPSVTFVLTGDILPTSSTDSSVSPTLSPQTAAVSSGSKSFWKNKAAVAAVFVIVPLIACGVFAVFIIALVKRRRARREQRLHSRLFDQYTDTGTAPSDSPDPSITSTPMNAFSTREIGYESPSFILAASTQPPQATSDVQHINYFNYQSMSKITNSGPPVAFHNRVAKRESAQPSIDSFYGGPMQPSGHNHYAT
ncbi:hypothetical protein BYT27DRAFT_7251833 [Phlegmacium glaucopus]|nr:hypothetical protein BYT27DRAFT_7251833 [Phlegmacium glaucopus]